MSRVPPIVTAEERSPTDRQPGPEEIEQWLTDLVEGRISRDEADRWAAGWVTDDACCWDDVTWWGLNLLYGVDLPAGPSGDYLHDDAQLMEWLTAFRHRRARSEPPTSGSTPAPPPN